MRPMQDPTREIEVKIPFDSPAAARASIEALGAEVRTPRAFEDNVLYDRAADALKPAGKILRLRRVDRRAWLTYKERTAEPAAGAAHLERIEHESAVADPDAVDRLLRGLGFRPAYRYQKYRTVYGLGDTETLAICLDETPIGCFVELEGAPAAIDDAARRMGVDASAYVLRTYRDLHREAAERGAAPADDMVFETAR